MPNDRFYLSPKWRSVRARHLRDHPFCAVCATIFIQTDATEVDHVIAKESVPDPYDHENLRSLCKTHHSQKTVATEGWHKGKRKFQVGGLDGFPIKYGDS